MGADDVHFVGAGRADLGAVDLFALAGRAGLRVERAQARVGLLVDVVIRVGGRGDTAVAGTADAGADFAAGDGDIGPGAATSLGRRGRRHNARVFHTLGVGAAVAFQLRFDPVDSGAIAIGAFEPIAELGEPLDRGFVTIEVEATDESLHGVAGGGGLHRWHLAPSRCADAYVHGNGNEESCRLHVWTSV